MNIIQAIILGIIQGITEWLPISSSGHLALTQTLFNISPPLLFNVILHSGTLIVIFIVFWKEILLTIKDTNKLIKIIIATLPILIVGFTLRDFIASIFTNPIIISSLLILNGLILYSTKFFKNKNKKITNSDSFIIGLFQALAILPGISRSGATISSALFKGIKREDAASFSFIISIIPIIGATVLEATKINNIPDLTPYIIGTLVSIVIGYFSLKWLLKLINKDKFQYFSYYCFILGAITLFFSLI